MLEKLSPEESTLLVSVIAIIISSGLETEDILTLATFISTISGNLFLIAQQRSTAEESSSASVSSAIAASRVSN